MFSGKIAITKIEKTEHSPGAVCIEITFDPDKLPITIVADPITEREISDDLRQMCDALIEQVLNEV